MLGQFSSARRSGLAAGGRTSKKPWIIDTSPRYAAFTMSFVQSTNWPAQAKADFEAALPKAVLELLQRKHLYQSVTVDLSDTKQRTASTSQGSKSSYDQGLRDATTALWVPVEPQLPGVPTTQPNSARDPVYIVFPTVKMFCRGCDGVEAHNLVHVTEVVSELAARTSRPYFPPTLQNFVVGYLCQGCKTSPEFFMIRREELRLTVVGRSPIEHIAVPAIVPKQHRKHFSGAIVAFQSGQILPALFMMRTFIEQFAASQVQDSTLRADAVLDAYMAALPEPVRAHFPSLREIYGRLSEAIHAAREDAVLFTVVNAQIVEHLDARRLYKVSTA